jgi:hypothetical protein
MARVYLYKMTNDDGTAPCVTDGLLTLCLCKPAIRSTARKDDWLIGVAANSLHADNRLIYIARITDRTIDGAYFREAAFRAREDCIYEWRNGAFALRRDARHHRAPGHLEHDLGSAPDYRRANSLLSNEYRYFGSDGSDAYKALFPAVAKAVEKLGRGHRVNHVAALERELIALAETCLATPAPRQGDSREPERRGACRPGKPPAAPKARARC